jgi:hypothetical protein
MSVRQLQANDVVTSASTECSSLQEMFFMTTSTLKDSKRKCHDASVVGWTNAFLAAFQRIEIMTFTDSSLPAADANRPPRLAVDF